MFQVNNLGKHFGQIAALVDVSFQVESGEILGLIGPNGAGKSTLFDCIAGVVPSDRGEIVRDDKSIAVNARSSLLFYIPDGIQPWPAQPVKWILDFTVGLLGGKSELCQDLTQQLDLTSFLDQPMGRLSKGQRKRALLAIGLLTRQPVLVIDEPFDGLDLRQAREAAELLRTHAGLGRTLFLSIHHIEEAARLCDRFILLNSGHVRGEGTIDELARLAGVSSPNLEEVFLALT